MKDMDKIVEEAVEKATKGKLFTVKRVVIGAVVTAAVVGGIALLRTVKKSHDDQEIDHEDVVQLAEKAAHRQIKDKTA